MLVKTEPFLNNRRNMSFPCGMVDRPFLRVNRCTNLAVVRVTDSGWHEYQNYRIRYYKASRSYRNFRDLPVMLKPLLCQHHLDLLVALDTDPKKAALSYG